MREAMTRQPEDLTGRPTSPPDDLVHDALASLDLAGALFLRADLSSPWALRSSKSEVLAHALEPGARTVVLFHVVLDGRLVIAIDGNEEQLRVGDVAILPRAEQHTMRGSEEAAPVPIGALLPPRPWSELPSLRYGGGGERTSIACGYLYSDALQLSPVLAAMPALVVVRPENDELRAWLVTNIRFALSEAEAGRARGDHLMRRLPELLFTECLSHHARTNGDDTGWLAAAADPIVGRAIAQLHREPKRAWSMRSLARACATSRSVLDERFRRLLGMAPMHYLTAWRLQVAARKLRATTMGVEEIAHSVGYGALASFSRAFKRHTGLSPRDWRARGRVASTEASSPS